MTEATAPSGGLIKSWAGERIASLDILRGVAVMGILAMNIVAFAMPFAAYFNPLAYGMEGPADFGSWLFSFILIEGKMRGFFSFLFGASVLLVLKKAEAAGRSAAFTHFSRMGWLLVFGLLHFYFIWFGDILTGYALIGMALYFFRDLSVPRLTLIALLLIAVQFLILAAIAFSVASLEQAAAAASANPDAVRQWQSVQLQLGVPQGQILADKLALYRGPWLELVRHRLVERGTEPFTSLLMMGWETLAYMLLGMAALKGGFLSASWSGRSYRRIAGFGLAISVLVYALLAWALIREQFTIPALMLVGMAGTTLVRPVMIVAYIALVIMATRGGGPLVQRIAAAGRAAFTNYLGTSLVMTSLFYGYGLGLYGQLSRIELWIPVLIAWAVMLTWSSVWLARFRYGPFEWLWRSLARWQVQPLRRGERIRADRIPG